MRPAFQRQCEALFKQAEGNEQLSDLEKPDFWALATKGDIALTTLLIRSLDRPDDEKAFDAFAEKHEETISTAYINAWKRGGSVLKMNAVLEHLDFLIDALRNGNKAAFERRRLIQAVNSIENAIAKAIDASEETPA